MRKKTAIICILTVVLTALILVLVKLISGDSDNKKDTATTENVTTSETPTDEATTEEPTTEEPTTGPDVELLGDVYPYDFYEYTDDCYR